MIQRIRRQPVYTMQWMSLALVIVFGTLTLYLHDPRFVMVKFTIAHIAIGAAMIKPNWMSRYLPQIVTDNLSKFELTLYSAMWPVMMFGLAAANLYIGFTMSQAAWTFFPRSRHAGRAVGSVRAAIPDDPLPCAQHHPCPHDRGRGGGRVTCAAC